MMHLEVSHNPETDRWVWMLYIDGVHGMIRSEPFRTEQECVTNLDEHAAYFDSHPGEFPKALERLAPN